MAHRVALRAGEYLLVEHLEVARDRAGGGGIAPKCDKVRIEGRDIELDTETVASASFFTDRRESCLNEAGDYLLAAAEGAVGPDHIKAELGEVLSGEHPGRESPDELTVFKSLGIAVEDLASAELVLRRARERGVGVEVEL